MQRSAVYLGLWGVSPFLTAGAMGKTFCMPSVRTYGLAIMACLFTVHVQAAWKQVSCPQEIDLEHFHFVLFTFQTISSIGINHFTMPFIMTTWFFMLVTSEYGDVRRNRRASAYFSDFGSLAVLARLSELNAQREAEEQAEAAAEAAAAQARNLRRKSMGSIPNSRAFSTVSWDVV